MNCLRTPVILVFCFFLLTCGIEEYYYLPQLPENNINRELNTKAEIVIPNDYFHDDQKHYASGFTIFYKIYISNSDNDTVDTILINNSRILSDYNVLYPYTDPANTTSITSLTTFSNRGFYELELEDTDIRDTVLSKNGGTFIIQFPTRPGDNPYIEYKDSEYYLLRSNGSKEGSPFSPMPPDRYFFNSNDLKNFENAIPTINADVSGQSDVNEQTNAYVSMYIVAIGQNIKNFTRLYGKPTHISIFKLTPLN